MIRAGEQFDDVQAFGITYWRGRLRPCPQRLHQMRSVLGRLGAIAEILQVGPFLGALVPATLVPSTLVSAALGVTVGAVVYCSENAGSTHESFPYSGCFRVAGSAGLRAAPPYQSDTG